MTSLRLIAWMIAVTLILACGTPTGPRPPAPAIPTSPAASQRPPFVNILDFGAIPSDGIDDTGAVRRAIAAAAMGTVGTGGTVYFPPGVFLVDTIDLDDLGTGAGRHDGVRLIGSGSSVPGSGTGGGTILKYDAAAVGKPLLSASALHVSIENITLDGDGRAAPVLQFIYLSSLIYVHGVTVTNAAPVIPGGYSSLVQLDGSRSENLKACPKSRCMPPLEVDNIVMEGMQLIQLGAPVFSALDVVGSNTFMITLRDSRLEGAAHLVHIASGAGVTLDGCDFGKAYEDIIRLDGLSQPTTVANSYTEIGS
jgi:Pectate lyase superfamily protein